jgi:hypothetical protein
MHLEWVNPDLEEHQMGCAQQDHLVVILNRLCN